MSENSCVGFDWDGSLLNEFFFNSKDSDVIRSNEPMLAALKKEMAQCKKKQVDIMSLRQCVGDDNSNACINQTGSIYPQHLRVSKYLGAKAGKFLMPDLYHDLKSGKTFKEARFLLQKGTMDYDKKKIEAKPPADWLHDRSKLTILYAMVHRFAKAHPKGCNNYYFYDDDETVLDQLHDYFADYPQLLPHNTTLHLRLYKGAQEEPFFKSYRSIVGMGKIDKKYGETVKEMAAMSIESTLYQNTCPVNHSGRPIRNYADAEKAGFLLTSPLNCVRDYRPGEKRASLTIDEPLDTPRLRAAASQITLFKPSEIKEKRKRKGSQLQEENLPIPENLAEDGQQSVEYFIEQPKKPFLKGNYPKNREEAQQSDSKPQFGARHM